MWSFIGVNAEGADGFSGISDAAENSSPPAASDCTAFIKRWHESANLKSEKSTHCPPSWDSVLCWPATPFGQLAKLRCFPVLNGIHYDTSQNASRLCKEDGLWETYSNYTACRDLHSHLSSPTPQGVETNVTLYFFGYITSLIALGVAVAIFILYKDLRCLRNAIHTNLMLTYILADLTWIITTVSGIGHTDTPHCVVILLLLNYFHLTNFFWMFVEGLYLYILVVETFTRENVNLPICLAIGWGVPLIFIVIWGVVRKYTSGDNFAEAPLADHCSWMEAHLADWLYEGPELAVLAVNSVFLIMIMWVLITKLRSATSPETQQSRKASKALLVLIPLLGTTYVLTIAGPPEGSTGSAIFGHIRAVLLSLQGFAVALFYCFLNSEVQNAVRHRWRRWRAARGDSNGANVENGEGGSLLHRFRRRLRLAAAEAEARAKDWSPRSRTESIRLYCSIPANNATVTSAAAPCTNAGSGAPNNSHDRQRESAASQLTTTSLLAADDFL